MSLEHFVDGLMSPYTGLGEEPKYVGIEDHVQRRLEERAYDLGQSLGMVSKIALGGFGLYSLYTTGAAVGMSVAGPLAIAAFLKWILVDPIFVRNRRKPITLGGIVKKLIPSEPGYYPGQPTTPAPAPDVYDSRPARE